MPPVVKNPAPPGPPLEPRPPDIKPGTPEFEALPWPREAPVLTAQDLCLRESEATRARLPLWGWLDATFPEGLDPEDVASLMNACAWRQLWAAQVDLGLVGPMGFPMSPSEFARQQGLAATATLWNQALRRLGYAIPSE